MLSLLASTGFELEGFGGLDRSLSGCELTYTGIGRENVLDTLEGMELSSELDGVLSVGFAGSLDPEFVPGDLCLVENVEAEGEEGRYSSDRGLRERAELALDGDPRCCDLLSAESAVARPEDKSSLGGEGFPIVDQETYWEAKVAEKEDLPFVGLRVVFDEVDRPLPPEGCYSESGGVRPLRLLAWFFRSPKRLAGTPGLFSNGLRARRRLAGAVEQVVPALSR